MRYTANVATAKPVYGQEEIGQVVLALPKRVTEDFLVAVSRNNPEYRFETTADGRLVISPLTGTFASFGEGELFAQIVVWNKKHRLGRVLPPSGGITLVDGAIKGPDAAFISEQRLAALPPNREHRAFEQVAPDAVFELLSPTDSLHYTVGKCEEYIETGSNVVVLLNAPERTVTLYRKGALPVVIRDAADVAIGSEMPGFTLDARAVFTACEPANDD
jgi:Uma2 family endonuclease